MMYIKWAVLALLDWVLLITIPIAAPIIAAFTREQPYGNHIYTWGWIWGTHDNPPQGDEGFVRKRALFVGVTTGFKGYLNRIHWMIRNPLYGYAKYCSIKYDADAELTFIGNPNISDKYKVPGWYFAKYMRNGKLLGFEFYCVLPWCKTRDLRMRLGWKMMTSKFEVYKFAQIVNSINPFDGYGDD